MDEKYNKLLNDILDEVNTVFVKTRRAYLHNGNTGDYIDRLGKLTNILMSVKTGLALYSQQAFATVYEHSKEE